MKNNKGQGVIELIFAVGVIVLVLGGVVGLILRSMGARTAGFDRKKATRLASMVMENLVEEKENDPETFWGMSSVSDEEMDGFDGYVYSVSFTDRSDECVGSCAQVVLDVGWRGSREEDQALQFNRFFAR